MRGVRSATRVRLPMEIFSANEYWVKAASLMTTDPTGKKDLPDSPFTRIYFMSSMQHGTGNGASKGACQQFLNPLDSQAVQRALFTALDKWVTAGIAPPPSQFPKLSDGTLVAPIRHRTGFPRIPGVTYTGLQDDALSAELRPEFLHDRNSDDQSAGIRTPPYQDNPAERPDLPELRAQNRRGRQRYRGHPAA